MKKLLAALAVTVAVTTAALAGGPWSVVAKFVLQGETQTMHYMVNGERAGYGSEDECRSILTSPEFLEKLANLQVNILLQTMDVDAANGLTASCVRDGAA